MDDQLYRRHLEAGRRAGIDRTCGVKRAYADEQSAAKIVERANQRPAQRHNVEPYPCAFCGKWHNGRVMSIEELNSQYPKDGYVNL